MSNYKSLTDMLKESYSIDFIEQLVEKGNSREQVVDALAELVQDVCVGDNPTPFNIKTEMKKSGWTLPEWIEDQLRSVLNEVFPNDQRDKPRNLGDELRGRYVVNYIKELSKLGWNRQRVVDNAVDVIRNDDSLDFNDSSLQRFGLTLSEWVADQLSSNLDEVFSNE